MAQVTFRRSRCPTLWGTRCGGAPVAGVVVAVAALADLLCSRRPAWERTDSYVA
jgi:hypothetical protein